MKNVKSLFIEWMLNFRLRIKTFPSNRMLLELATGPARHQSAQDSMVLAYHLLVKTDVNNGITQSKADWKTGGRHAGMG